MKEEFVSMLQFVSKHRDYVSALDELSMSFSRMIAAAPGERIDPSEEHFKMHLIEAPERLSMLAATHSEGYVVKWSIYHRFTSYFFAENWNTIVQKHSFSFFKRSPLGLIVATLP